LLVSNEYVVLAMVNNVLLRINLKQDNIEGEIDWVTIEVYKKNTPGLEYCDKCVHSHVLFCNNCKNNLPCVFLEIDTLKTSSLKVKQLFLDPFGEHLLISCGNITSSQLFYATKQLSKLKPVREKNEMNLELPCFFLFVLDNKLLFNFYR